MLANLCPATTGSSSNAPLCIGKHIDWRKFCAVRLLTSCGGIVHLGLSALCFLLQHLMDFFHHIINIPIAYECVVDGAVGVDKHPNGHSARLTSYYVCNVKSYH